MRGGKKESINDGERKRAAKTAANKKMSKQKQQENDSEVYFDADNEALSRTSTNSGNKEGPPPRFIDVRPPEDGETEWGERGDDDSKKSGKTPDSNKTFPDASDDKPHKLLSSVDKADDLDKNQAQVTSIKNQAHSPCRPRPKTHPV